MAKNTSYKHFLDILPKDIVYIAYLGEHNHIGRINPRMVLSVRKDTQKNGETGKEKSYLRFKCSGSFRFVIPCEGSEKLAIVKTPTYFIYANRQDVVQDIELERDSIIRKAEALMTQLNNIE